MDSRFLKYFVFTRNHRRQFAKTFTSRHDSRRQKTNNLKFTKYWNANTARPSKSKTIKITIKSVLNYNYLSYNGFSLVL